MSPLRPRHAVLALMAATFCSSLLATVPATAQGPTCDGKPATQSGTSGTEGDDVLIGTEGDDHLDGKGGNDAICGLGGNDRLSGGVGDDFLDGGDGIDVADYAAFDQTAVTVDLMAGSAGGGAGSDRLALGSLENVELNCSVDNDDTVVGDDDANAIVGGSGDDTIVGNGGNDVIFGLHPSVERSDALCHAQGTVDADEIDAGEGDDRIFGHLGPDSIDAGPGFDVIDGGSESDVCNKGERYARCETMEPPAPPPTCNDAADNDGDGALDHPGDPDCASPEDPTETTGADHQCFDGLDNDGDSLVDYPEDHGCTGFDQGREPFCALPCPPASLTISHRRRAFEGNLVAYSYGPPCYENRPVVVRRKRRGRDAVVGRGLIDENKKWRIPYPARRGRYYAFAPKLVTESSEGDTVSCPARTSAVIRLR